MNWKETPPPTLSCEACACTLAGCHYVSADLDLQHLEKVEINVTNVC